MEGKRLLGQHVEIQRQAHGGHQGAKVSEVVYTQTPSDSDRIDIAAVREALSQHQKHLPITLEEDAPKSFREILAPHEGDTCFQRLAKWYIRPRGNPETTMKVLEALQVHRFQELPKLLAKRSNNIQISQSSNTINDSRLSSLLDYATHKTLMNEIGRLAGLGKGMSFS